MPTMVKACCSPVASHSWRPMSDVPSERPSPAMRLATPLVITIGAAARLESAAVNQRPAISSMAATLARPSPAAYTLKDGGASTALGRRWGASRVRVTSPPESRGVESRPDQGCTASVMTTERSASTASGSRDASTSSETVAGRPSTATIASSTP
jgi:hypothetical protein